MKRRFYTSEEIEFLVKNYPHIRSNIIAQKLKRNINTIYSKAAQLGLSKTEEFRKSKNSGVFINGHNKGNTTRFQKGHTPVNKGKKQSEYMSAEAIDRCKATQFKKGNTPVNTKKDGHISIRKDNRGIQYKYIRIKKNEWQPLHRHIWEMHHGEIPAGYNVVFKDDNPLNCTIENLELLSNEKLMLRNSFHRYGPEIAGMIQIKGVLQRQINKINNK